MDDDDLTPQDQEFLEAFRAMPEEYQDAMERFMNYVATNPVDKPRSQEEMDAILKSFMRPN